jgi:hypothetical protein
MGFSFMSKLEKYFHQFTWQNVRLFNQKKIFEGVHNLLPLSGYEIDTPTHCRKILRDVLGRKKESIISSAKGRNSNFSHHEKSDSSSAEY